MVNFAVKCLFSHLHLHVGPKLGEYMCDLLRKKERKKEIIMCRYVVCKNIMFSKPTGPVGPSRSDIALSFTNHVHNKWEVNMHLYIRGKTGTKSKHVNMSVALFTL